MKLNKLIFSITTVVCLSLSSFAQDSLSVKQGTLDDGTIEEQFNYIVRKSNKYQDYRVVKQTWINKLKSHVVDSIQVVEKALEDSKSTVGNQQAEINSLKNEVAQLNTNLDNINEEKDSIVFLGMLMEKGAYKGMMWGIIGLLFVLMSVFIYKFKRANLVTSEAKTRLGEIQEEFETYRKNSREKEQKLKRELQDEINKSL